LIRAIALLPIAIPGMAKAGHLDENPDEPRARSDDWLGPQELQRELARWGEWSY
jgi:hypothetical protein